MAKSDLARYAVTISRPPEDVYRFWRNFENLPRFSRHLKSVEVLDDKRSRWTTEGPNGDVTWEAEMTEDVPGHRISWQSLEGADVQNMGSVEFVPAPGKRGTELYASMQFDAPGGAVGEFYAKMTGNDPEQEVGETMRRCKAILECGEIPIIEGQPSNRARGENEPGDMSKKVGMR